MFNLFDRVLIKPTGETGTVLENHNDGYYLIDLDVPRDNWDVDDVKEDDLILIRG